LFDETADIVPLLLPYFHRNGWSGRGIITKASELMMNAVTIIVMRRQDVHDVIIISYSQKRCLLPSYFEYLCVQLHFTSLHFTSPHFSL
tara:strand:+ start:210 stop:476 length:267 start_codon:yes stop_codon:yes gene_type:complete